jgi:putative ABC transport system permease protein
MAQWDEYGLIERFNLTSAEDGFVGLKDNDPTRGVIGVGLARILGLCERLHLKDCPTRPPENGASVAANPGGTTDVQQAPVLPQDVSTLLESGQTAAVRPGDSGLPRIDLLGATAGGAPNVVSLYVAGAQYQGAKELDDTYVGMHISLAQQLLYGRGQHKVTAIVLQLNRGEDMARVRARLGALFKEHGLPLEVHDFTELVPMYNEVTGLFNAVFAFIAVIIGVIVLFTVVNTMSMSVMERTNEIGTSRAMGVRRSGIRRQFVMEGCMLGAIGATAGVVVAFILAAVINRAGLTWMAPGQAAPIPLRVLMVGTWTLLLGTWFGLIVLATIASLIPANRGARMPVVDALRHV